MRQYTIRGAPEYGYYCGSYRGYRCIIGLLAPYVVLLRFDAIGNLVRVQQTLLPAVARFRVGDVAVDLNKPFRKCVKRLITKGYFVPSTIVVLMFRLDVMLELFENVGGSGSCRIGIDELPPHGLVNLAKIDICHPDVKSIVDHLSEWETLGMYRFWWGNGYDMDSRGNCISS